MRSFYLIPAVLFAVIGWLLLPDTGELVTPLEEKDYTELTQHAELANFVERLAERSERIEVETLGTSVEGRRIPYLKISDGAFGVDESKLTVLLFAQQHGNEPSGMEASLMMARDIAEGAYSALLQDMDILLVPQVNPDGGDRHQRRNANNVDLNRSHLILNAPETVALRELYHEWLPEVTLDIHEYQPWSSSWVEHGYIRLFDEQYGLPTNLNTASSIRSLGEEEFLPYVESYLDQRGFTFHNYTVGSPDYIRYSTSSINDGRQGLAIMNSFSLILEGKRARGETENIKRRAEGQQAAVEALLHFVAEHKDTIRETVETERQALREGRGEEFVLTQDREQRSGPLSIPVAAVESNGDRSVITDTITVDIEAYYPEVAPREVTTYPEAYLVPAAEHELIELLRQHRVEMDVLEGGEELEAEQYTLDRFQSVELANSTYEIPEVTVNSMMYTAEEGDVLIPTAQLRRNLISIALEPQSKHGLIHYDAFAHLREGTDYPVLRLTSY